MCPKGGWSLKKEVVIEQKGGPEPAGDQWSPAGRGPSSNRLRATFKFFIFFGSVEMGLAVWENGCATPPFFEACPYTWKCYIFHSSWNLEIIFFQVFLLKLEDTWTFTVGILFMKK
jgi:hypothetical protein